MAVNMEILSIDTRKDLNIEAFILKIETELEERNFFKMAQ
jgi:hypothetical protein